MKINMYRLDKIKEKKKYVTYSLFIQEIKKEEYECVSSIIANDLKYELFVYERERKTILWLEELIKSMGAEEFVRKYGNIYNGILIRKPKRPEQQVYVMPFGHAFHIVQRFCDYNFAMDFAEKEITKDGVILKASDFIQSNKIRALLNIKDDYITSAEGGESYKFVSGKPMPGNEIHFGNKIECGYSLHFSREFEFKNRNDFIQINELIKQIEIVLKKKTKVNPFPRVSFFNKKEIINGKLNLLAMSSIFAKKESFEVYVGAFDVIGSKILMLDNSRNYILYIKNEKKDTEKRLEHLNKKNVEEFFISNRDVINSLDDVMVIIEKDGLESSPDTIRKYLFSIIEENEKKYMLTAGRWGIVNRTFTEEVEKSLEVLDDECLQVNDTLEYKYNDEDDYVETLVKKKNCVQLHKKDVYISRDMNVKKNKIELADIYDKDSKELYAIKLGKSNQAFIYSFDQANSASKALINNSEYNLELQLLNYGIDAKDVSDILNCKTYSVVLGLEQNYLKKAIRDKNEAFSLTKLQSFLLKLKIISSAGYIRGQGLKFKIHVFAGEKK